MSASAQPGGQRAAVLDAAPSLVISVGDAVIDSVPGWLERAAIAALGVAAGAVAVAGSVGGWLLTGRERLDSVRRAIRLPRPFRSAGPVPPGADLEIAGLTPMFVPNAAFYRIDTALRCRSSTRPSGSWRSAGWWTIRSRSATTS
ncbi:hypothetical protein [Modestobacter sp. SYSU DS0290]